MSWNDIDKDRLAQIIRQTTGNDIEKTEITVKPSIIKGKGVVYLWSPTNKAFLKANRGSLVYVISYEKDDQDRVLIYDGFNILAIHEEDIEEIGFN
jgi:hypothetical protein